MLLYRHFIAGISGLFISGFAWVAQAAPQAAGEEVSGGLPQFNPSTYSSQIFWLAVTFIVLYIFFSKRTLPEISSVIENRKEHIKTDLDMAEKLRREAEDINRSYEEKLEESRAEASRFYADAEQKIKERTLLENERFLKKSGIRIQETEQEIEKGKSEAMEQMSSIAAEIAKEAAEKIVGIDTDIDQAKTAVQTIKKKAA